MKTKAALYVGTAVLAVSAAVHAHVVPADPKAQGRADAVMGAVHEVTSHFTGGNEPAAKGR